MDIININFQVSPFSGFAGFTNDELECIWKYLYSHNSKLPDKIEFEKLNETDNGTKIMASKNGNFNETEILYKEVSLFKDDSLLTKIYSAEQLSAIISKIEMNGEYNLKIYEDKSNENLNDKKSKI